MDLTSDERRRLGMQALKQTLAYFDAADAGPVYPRAGADELTARFDEPLPTEPQDGERILKEYADLVAPAGRNNGHPRMFGYVSSSAAFVGVLGDLLASTANQNVTSWRSAPGPTTIERLAVGWIGEMVGYDPAAVGLLTSGGSMANFMALAAAVRRQTGVDVTNEGVRALEREPVIYASAMGHMSIPKAAGLLGLGRRAVRHVPVGEDFTIDLAALEAAVAEDTRAGRQPIAVVANAGDVNTGAIDPIAPLADFCRRHALWLHADAAYGGFAALVPELRERFTGLDQADSITLDPHKWLFVPLDVGCVLTRDPAAFRAVFSHGADYMDVLAARGESPAAFDRRCIPPRGVTRRSNTPGMLPPRALQGGRLDGLGATRDSHQGLLGAPSDFAFWDYGPELSRRFRALKIWMTLKRHGTIAIGRAIAENVRLAARLGALVDEADDFERLAPVVLSIVCFRYVPDAIRRARDAAAGEARAAIERRLDALNEAITIEVQRGAADAYFSNATLNGRFALRACLVNYRTTEADLVRLLDTVRDVAGSLRA